MLPFDLQRNLALGKNAKYYVHMCKNLHLIGWTAGGFVLVLYVECYGLFELCHWGTLGDFCFLILRSSLSEF